jgi:uncharacterized damage-inducible protein DinB
MFSRRRAGERESEFGGTGVNELERSLIGNSAAAPPAHILEGLGPDLAHRQAAGAPRTIYEELWHIAFWQQMTLDWIRGQETAYPEQASTGFPTAADAERESWEALCRRFFASLRESAEATRDAAWLERVIRCPSPPGAPVRTMTVREQLESLSAHNAYHFGRIVLLRQIHGSWPPASGGDSW